MTRSFPQQLIQVGDHQISLPEGVTVLDWALERVSWQNPRIRAFLGCIHILHGILESNYSILHSSPERLLDIWSKVRKVSTLIRRDITPLLAAPSRIPSLEAARRSAELSLRMADHQVIEPMERFGETVPPEQLLDLRKALCIAISQLHSFLQDTFGELMAGDPRSLHDADYFLSRRFPQDIEEAEWLHATVDRLQDYLERLEPARARNVTALARTLETERTIPRGQSWEDTMVLLEVLLNGLAPKLKEVLALRGVRFYEIEILDRYAAELPTRCRVLIEIHEAACEALDRLTAAAGDSLDEAEQSALDLAECHLLFSHRMARLLGEIDRCLQDLIAFVPIWLESIEKRRALLLRKSAGEPVLGT